MPTHSDPGLEGVCRGTVHCELCAAAQAREVEYCVTWTAQRMKSSKDLAHDSKSELMRILSQKVKWG